MNVAGALLYGFANLLHPRMLWLMVWPMLVSLVFWGAVAAAFWERLAAVSYTHLTLPTIYSV